MSPPIPLSLSPHICILESPDLSELLENSSIPPLPNILQSFSPLPQLTTRTTTLVPIPHKSFALRFSNLVDVEDACREDEEQRAIRTIDWMTARINKRCHKWVQEAEALGHKESMRTPWWDELRRCAEGDFVPAKTEGWNHPIAVILAVSTTAPNPLATITALHARSLQFPPWVDNNFLKYTLIIHPHNSPLSEEEASALFNAVKRQFGLHTYLLPLELPKTAPFVVVPALMPRLPTTPSPESPPQQHPSTPTSPNTPGAPTTLNTLKMDERDIQQTARFAREFVVMSILPWMEKCVVEWNENFSSTRRLPSRLFSSTRRLFGSQPTTPVSTPPPSFSTSSPPGRNSISQNGGPAPPSQQRRLAEFATILGDLKLAVTVWEALRKESKGGSDILPFLLSPSPTIPLYAQSALTLIHPNMSDLPSHAQIRALLYAVRWEAGIETPDFLSDVIQGERWLVWAANNAEEAPSALLLAQAALMSSKKKARRRAALWYVLAANRLEKCGIKPLTMYFLRKAQDIYNLRVPKELSPSFWDSEAKSPNSAEGLEDIMSGIEHPLSRLLYTTGDVAGAVRLFLSLLRGAPAFSVGLLTLSDGTAKASGNDKLYLDDFRVAYNYWKATEPEEASQTPLQIPFKLCVSKLSRLRFPGDIINADTDVWSSRQEDWKTFWKSQGGKSAMTPSGKVCTNDLFWVDLILQNPLDAEINLSDVTVVVQETSKSQSGSVDDFVEVEVIKEFTLGPMATCSIPISLKSKLPAKLSITHAKYKFLSQLPTTESLASRGRRLYETALQRQQPTYATDIIMQVEVVPAHHRLTVSYVEDERLVLLQGENKSTRLWLMNAGSRPINEVWMICGPDDEIWMGADDLLEGCTALAEVFQSQNSLKPQEPRCLTLKSADNSSSLQPGDSLEVPIIFHSEATGNHELFLLFVFREGDSQPFHSTKLARAYEVQPLFDISVSAEPSQLDEHAYVLDVDMTNISQSASVELTQITSLSPQWSCDSLSDSFLGSTAPSQCSRLLLGASQWKAGASSSREISEFVSKKLDNLLKGGEVDHSTPPPSLVLHCSHIAKTTRRKSIQGAAIMNFIASSRRKFVSRNIVEVHPYIPPTSHSAIFPLYNPAAVDLILFWEIGSRNLSGHLNVHGITLGAGHAALDSVIEDAEGAKVKRSMYTETRRENMEVLDSIRGSEWNTEMNPIVLSYKGIGPKVHDFATGPCHVSLEFVLRNHSLALPAQYTLKLQSKSTSSASLLPAPYIGRLTFRGEIPPSEAVTIRPKLWITRPGAYSLGGWSLETSVSTSPKDAGQNARKRRYLQESSTIDKETAVIICGSRNPE